MVDFSSLFSLLLLMLLFFFSFCAVALQRCCLLCAALVFLRLVLCALIFQAELFCCCRCLLYARALNASGVVVLYGVSCPVMSCGERAHRRPRGLADAQIVPRAASRGGASWPCVSANECSGGSQPLVLSHPSDAALCPNRSDVTTPSRFRRASSPTSALTSFSSAPGFRCARRMILPSVT